MENKEKKSKLKEVLKAAGVTGAGAAIGGAIMAPDDTVFALRELGSWDSPIDKYTLNKFAGKGGLYEKIEENPNLGIGINAAASGLGALAAYGVLKGVTKGIKKAIHNRDEKKLEMARAIGESAKSGRA